MTSDTSTPVVGETCSGSVLGTEDRNPRTANIDRLPPLDALRLINDEDQHAVAVVRAALPQLAKAVELIVPLYRDGGSIHYFGAGTSGRLSVLDAAEVPPTYGIAPGRFVAHIAGGAEAMTQAVEDAEDAEAPAAELVGEQLVPGDIVVGIAASGNTPYAVGALREAKRRGIATVGIVCSTGSKIEAMADVTIVLPTGPEAITGSTRMKAATAQKIVLHSLSTEVMVRTGHTFSNVMIGVVPSNAKLRRRVTLMLQQVTGCDREQAKQALGDAQGDPRVAIDLLRERLHPVEQRVQGYLGLDCGGTGMRLVFAPLDPMARSSRAFASWQGHFTALPLARHGGQELLDGVAGFLKEHPALDVLGIGVGLAGAGAHPDAAKTVADALAAQQGVPVHVFPDGLTQYYAAHGEGIGGVLAVGTGAVAYGITADRRLHRCDGLGFLVGDFGSGSRIGADGARAAVRSLTGRVPRDPELEECFLAHFGSLENYAALLAGNEPPATVYARFAAPFLALTETAHVVAEEVCANACDDLIHTLDSVTESALTPVTLIGGVLGEHSPVGREVRRRLADRGTPVTAPQSTAEEAAAVLARQADAGDLNEPFTQQLAASASLIAARTGE